MPHLLAIGVNDLIQVVVPILFLVLWALSQVVGRRRDQPAPPAKGGRRPARPQALDDLSQEVEEFLKRAAQKGAGPPPQAAGQQPASGRKVPRKPTTGGRKPAVVTAEIAPSGELSELRRRHEVAAHVGDHLRGHRFDQETSQLGDEVEHVEEQAEARLHAKFDHQVGRLAETDTFGYGETGQQETDASAPAARAAAGPVEVQPLGALLRSPAGIRQAMILLEILTRPEDRW